MATTDVGLGPRATTSTAGGEPEGGLTLAARFDRLAARYSEWLLDHPRLVIWIAALLSVAIASGTALLTFRSDHRIFFASSNEELHAYERFEATYVKSDSLVFVVTPKSGNVFEPATLQALLTLTEGAWTLPDVKRVDSLVNYQNVTAKADDIVIDDLLRAGDPLGPADAARLRAVALADPLIVDRLISADGAVTGIAVSFDIGATGKDAAIPAIMRSAEALRDKIQAKWPDLAIRLSGSAALDYAFVEAIVHDGSVLIPLMIVAILCVTGIILGSVGATLACFAVVGLGIAVALGAAGLLGIPLSPPSASAPNVIMTVAVADCIHVALATIHGLRAGLGRREAVHEALVETLRPIFLTNVTTSIGFFSLAFADTPPFVHLGVISAIGVIAACILSVTLLPAALLFLPLRLRDPSRQLVVTSDRIADIVCRHPIKLIVVIGGLGIVLALLALTNRQDEHYVDYFDDSYAFRRDTDYMTAKLTGFDTIEYSLEQTEEGGVVRPEYLAEVDAFAAWFRQQPEVWHVRTIADTLKRINRAMHGDDPARSVLPGAREAAAQYLLLYEMSLPYGIDLKDQITVDKRASRMTVSMRDTTNQGVIDLVARADAWARANLKIVQPPHATGSSVIFSNIADRNNADMLVGTIAAFSLISLLMLAIFGFNMVGFFALVTNMVPAQIALGVWALAVGQVGLAVSVIATMTFGIVVDDTVHFVSHFQNARRKQGLGPEAAIRHAFHALGPAVLTTSTALTAGFLCLSLSSFQINAWIGLMAAMTIAVALVIELFVLPAILLKMGERAR